jgi:hypothetical protein
MITLCIKNDGTGNAEVGNYSYVLMDNGKLIYEGRVENHIRCRGWRGLLLQLAMEAYKAKIDEDNESKREK